jgi:hypothetical protein
MHGFLTENRVFAGVHVCMGASRTVAEGSG